MEPSLPEPLLADIFRSCVAGSPAAERRRLALVCRASRDAVREGWEEFACEVHGPLDWGGFFRARSVLQPSRPLADVPSREWGALHLLLRQELPPRLRRSVKQAVDFLREQQLLRGPQPELEYPWLASRLRAFGLNDRRRVASYVCVTAESQPYRILDSFIRCFELHPPHSEETDETGTWVVVGDGSSAPTPVAALRHLLLQFPFLPIDAGGGADRVIGAIARCYTAAFPCVADWLGLSGGDTKQVTEGVHLLVYAAIMLTTDLHNPAVQPKMTRDEFAASLHRSPALAGLDEDRMAEIYDDIAALPLKIHRESTPIDTFVRSSGDGAADQVLPATYSRYSRHTAKGQCVAAKRRLAQLGSARGRSDLRFLARRWFAEHYTVIRACAFLLVLAVAFCDVMSSGGEGLGIRSLGRSCALAVFVHFATRL